MKKYQAVRQLMADGEFRQALDHIVLILQKNPDDEYAKQLEYTCREMVHIQNVCEEDPEQKNDISVKEYISVHFRRIMKELCRFIFCTLTKLPLEWQQKIRADKFQVWEKYFTLESDRQKDWLWELVFWDVKRRRTVFISLTVVLLLFITLFLLLFFRKPDDAISPVQQDFTITVKLAHEGDAQAQFLVGKNFYYGENVKRDVDQALLWLTKSARTGHTQAAKLLQKILVERDIHVQGGQNLWEKND